ncbi:uncharacterized protein LOC131842029 [Achroia grisella]|uniref:uncharacterized protein LOC131842029 n=1 Tax=Achroia grisella TaxID=688607 RepID=UPI0027D33CA3|nr:uncharacterized protein LOC131842029 [Achroia grisella]
MERSWVKLPPNFDIRTQSAATEWRAWKSMFIDYLVAVGSDKATDQIKLSLLRNMMGPESTKIILSFKLSKEDSENYNKVLQEIENYVKPKSNDVFERYKFNERKQLEGENFESFYTNLRLLIVNCNYIESIEDDLLRDRIVQGIFDKQLQESLLRVENLTLDKATSRCRAAEASRSQVMEMNPTCIEVDRVKSYGNKRTEKKFQRNINNKFDCRRCKSQHGPRECPAYGKKCAKCGILNHFAVSCKVKKISEAVCNKSNSSNEELFCGVVLSNIKKNRSEWEENIQIEDKIFKCKLDTGADVSILPKSVFDKLNYKLNCKIQKTELTVQSFTGENIKPIGIVNLKCKYKNKICNENFVIAEASNILLGLPACVSLNLVKRIHSVQVTNNDKDKFVNNNIVVFEGIGRLPGKVEIPTRATEEYICHPSPRLPSCLLEPLKAELNRLVERKSIVKVNNISENAYINRMVIVEKPNRKVRLCLDPLDLNKIIVKKPKCLPTLEDLSFKLQGKKFFSVLDLTEGFHHLSLSEESSWKCCFATPYGVYRYLVLPYGLMNAPELFQDVLESHFSELSNVIMWADDILVMGNTEKEHDLALQSVIQKAKKLGIVFNKNKFQYKQREVKYVGQVFNEYGMSLDQDRVESLVNLKEPSNRDELRQILGSFNYVRRYVPDMANIMAPLFNLLKKNSEFTWLPAHSLTFTELKRKICSAPSLTPFDPKKKIILQCDAIVVDYFSHWLEVLPLSDKTSSSVINAFQEVFMRFGYPEEVIADNNPFNSFECLKYFKSKDISLITSSPHYPKSNGMAEKAVEENIHKLLLLKQSVLQKEKFVKKKEMEYKIGDKVVHKTDKDKFWRKGIIVGKCKEPRSYWIQKEGEDRKIRRNIKHIKKSFSDYKSAKKLNPFLSNYDEDFDQESDINLNVPISPRPVITCRNQVPLSVTTRYGRTTKPRRVLDL